MKQINKLKFTEEQRTVINDTERLNNVYETLLNLSSDESISLTRKKVLMFQQIIIFMRTRKCELLAVGIKSKIADTLIQNEIKTLNEVTKELKNVISQNN